MISCLTSSPSALPIRNSTGQGQAIRLYRQEIRNKRLRRRRRTRRDCPSAPSAARLSLRTRPYLHSARSAAPTLLWRPAPPAPLARSTILGQQRPEVIRLLRSEEHTSELQSLMRNSYAVFCLKKKKNNQT